MLNQELKDERGFWVVGNKNKSNDQDKEQKRDNIVPMEQNKKKKISWKEIFTGVSITVIAGLILYQITIFRDLPHDVSDLKENVANLDTRMDELETEIGKLGTRVGKLETKVGRLEERIDGIDTRVTRLENVRDSAITAKATSYPSFDKNNVTNMSLMSAPSWSSGTVIAVDSNNKEYTAADLVNKKVLTYYKSEADEDVIFCGQYSEDYKWDGNCLINLYSKDGKLALITEASYDNGTLLSYKQALPSVTKAGKSVWIKSERYPKEDVNYGDSWSYYSLGDITRNFNLEDITVSDLLYTNDVVSETNNNLESFYHGSTSNGLYNDTSGEAYQVKYNSDGTVHTLYCGNFVDGAYNDDTGNAWYITKEENTAYMYYKGRFKNNNTMDKPTEVNFINPLDQKEIDIILAESGIDFKCALEWKK